tara:strand:- start:36512 stop:38032 length:1521 start_codon:yes stop_codon:yes gene_type:complete
LSKQLDKFNELNDLALQGGGPKRVSAQKDKGKFTARDRIDELFDEDSFHEIGRLVSFDYLRSGYRPSSVVTGYGFVNGRKVFVYSQDFTIDGGALSEESASKICKIMDLALNNGCPVVGFIDSGGAKIQEGVFSLAGYSSIFEKNIACSGVIPQISAIYGPAAGGATYSPALTDFIFMVDQISQMYITGPDVVKAVTGENVTHQELGGVQTHAFKSGVSHFVHQDEETSINAIKELLAFLPQNNMETPPKDFSHSDVTDGFQDINKIIPDDKSVGYDVLDVISNTVDAGTFLQIHENFARNIVVGFGRLDGTCIGVIANQPAVMAGALDIDASNKAARFVRFCDAFNIPLITFVDVPGFMPGVSQESLGIIRHGAKLIYAYAEASVPKISLILRKAYGGAYIVMSSKNLRGDVNYALPFSEIAVMGAEGAVNIVNRKELSTDDSLREKLVSEYQDKLMNPFVAASKGLIDEVIDTELVREKLISAVGMLENKRESLPFKKHGNIPL